MDATQTQTQAATQPLIDDAIQAEKEVQALIAAYKAGGAAGVAALLPGIAPQVEKTYADVKAALPTIKAGYKTSEFWIVVLVGLGFSILTAMGKVPPMDGTAVVGALTAVYTVVRGLMKKQA